MAEAAGDPTSSPSTTTVTTTSDNNCAVAPAIPDGFLETHSWTTKLKGCFCNDIAALPGEDPAYFEAFPSIGAFRRAMRDSSDAHPKSSGARMYLTHRFIVHKIRVLASTSYPTPEGSLEAQKQAARDIADLMGDISFLVDADNPGVFASTYVENFVKCCSAAIPVAVRTILSILELDRLVAEDEDLDAVLKYSPPPPLPPPQQPPSQDKNSGGGTAEKAAKVKTSSELLLLTMKQNAKSVGQFSKALRDPSLAFRQISLQKQSGKQPAPKAVQPQPITACNNSNNKNTDKNQSQHPPQATKRKRRW